MAVITNVNDDTTFTGNDVYEARQVIIKEEQEARRAAARAAILAFGKDTYAEGTVFQYTSPPVREGGKPTTTVIIKTADGWYQTGSSYRCSWSELVDNLLAAKLTLNDLQLLVAAGAAASDVAAETPAA